jgi:hypothetical protein
MSRGLALGALIGLSTLTASAQESIPPARIVAPTPDAVPDCTRTASSGQGSAYVVGAGNNGGSAAFACNNGFTKIITNPSKGLYCLTLSSKGARLVKAPQVTVDAAQSGCIGAGPFLCFAQFADIGGCPASTPVANIVAVITGVFNGTAITYTNNINFTVYVP